MARWLRRNVGNIVARSHAWWLPTAGASLLSGSLLFSVGLPSCTVTHSPGQGWDVRFAPDMVITVVGLEDAKDQLWDLWHACLSGQWTRPCTPEEIEKIADAYNNVIGKKAENSASGGRHAPNAGKQ